VEAGTRHPGHRVVEPPVRELSYIIDSDDLWVIQLTRDSSFSIEVEKMVA